MNQLDSDRLFPSNWSPADGLTLVKADFSDTGIVLDFRLTRLNTSVKIKLSPFGFDNRFGATVHFDAAVDSTRPLPDKFFNLLISLIAKRTDGLSKEQLFSLMAREKDGSGEDTKELFFTREEFASRACGTGGNSGLLYFFADCRCDCGFCNLKFPKIYVDGEPLAVKHYLPLIEKTPSLTLTRAEPTFFKDLPEIIRAAVHKGVGKVNLETNGLKLADSGYVRRLKKAGLYACILAPYSDDFGTHDKLVGKHGAGEAIWKAIENCRTRGIRPIIQFLAVKSTIPRFGTFLEKLEREKLSLSFFRSLVCDRDSMEASTIAKYLRHVVPYNKLADEIIPMIPKSTEVTKGTLQKEPLCLYRSRLAMEELKATAIRTRDGKVGNVCPFSDCAFFDSCIGPHRFYLEQYGTGGLKPF